MGQGRLEGRAQVRQSSGLPKYRSGEEEQSRKGGEAHLDDLGGEPVRFLRI